MKAEEGVVFIAIPGDTSASPGKRKSQDMNPTAPKCLKSEVRNEHPPFYYSIHRHAIGGLNITKLSKILQDLSDAGFLASRTHFDPTGIRTNASLATLKAILKKNSSLTNTSQISSIREGSESQSDETPLPEATTLSDLK